MALMMILILSGAAALLVRYISISAHHRVDSYLREQAEIFMQSVIEATILKIEGQDRESGCVRSLRFVSPDQCFNAYIKVTRYYLYNNENVGQCTDKSRSIATPESHGYVIIEAVVEGNMSHPKLAGFAEPLRITERTLQRP